MQSFQLTLAYDGTAYAGWQLQPGRRTLQGTLEEALHAVTGQQVRVVGSGRTDAGVHALGQVASVSVATHLEPDVLCRALNANLPGDFVVRQVCAAPPGFHAIRDAVGKRYRYVIQQGPLRDVFVRSYSWHVHRPLDVVAMQRAAQTLRGTHDFASFQASGSERASTVRTIRDILVERRGDELSERLVIEVEADGFLYNMVRNIVGTLVELGWGGRPEGWMTEVLAARDRRVAGRTAPAQGLFLLHVAIKDPACVSPI